MKMTIFVGMIFAIVMVGCASSMAPSLEWEARVDRFEKAEAAHQVRFCKQKLDESKQEIAALQQMREKIDERLARDDADAASFIPTMLEADKLLKSVSPRIFDDWQLSTETLEGTTVEEQARALLQRMHATITATVILLDYLNDTNC